MRKIYILFSGLLILPIFIGCTSDPYYEKNKKMYNLYVERINTANSRKLYSQSLNYYKYWVNYCRKSANRKGFERECNQMETGYYKLRNDMSSGKKVDLQKLARDKKRKEKSEARYKYYEAKMGHYEDGVTKNCRDIEQGFPVVGSDGKTMHGPALTYWYKSHNCKQR